MSKTVRYLNGPVINDLTNAWISKGYVKEKNHLIKKITKIVKKKLSKNKIIRVSQFANKKYTLYNKKGQAVGTAKGRTRLKGWVNGFGKKTYDKYGKKRTIAEGKVISLIKEFGPELTKQATHIELLRAHEDIPIVRKEKRVEITKIPYLKPGENIRVTLYYIKKVAEESIDDIPIERISFEAYVSGTYKRREIEIRGRKTMIIGARPPKGAGTNFWKTMYSNIKQEILNVPEEGEASGLWIEKFVNDKTRARGQTKLIPYAKQAGPNSNFTLVFKKKYWLWTYTKFPEDAEEMFKR